MSSNNSETLVKALGVLIGEIAVSVNGPFLFDRFGVYVPIAVAMAAVIGAAAGYGIAAILYRVNHREHVVTPVPAMRRKQHPKAA